MDGLIEEQNTLLGRMSRALDNAKKQGMANVTRTALETHIRNLDARWKQFQDNDATIRRTATAEEKKDDYFTLDVFGCGEDAYCQQRGELMAWAERFETPKTHEPSTAAPVVLHMPRSTLPKIDLPTFSGSYQEWRRFRDLFKSLVVDDASWSDAERFHYLTASLSGEASQIVQRVPITAGNFKEAWTLLDNRYENRRLLIDAQFDALYNMKPIRSHTAGEIQRVLNTVSNVVSALKSLEIIVNDKSVWIVQFLVRRLDDQTLTQWERSLGNQTDPPSLSDLLKFLESTTRTLEAIETRHGTHRSAPPAPVKLVHTATGATSGPRRSACALCQGSHPVYFCAAFKAKAPQERLHWVRSAGLCLNCLSQHDPRSCRTTKTCQQCAQAHHTTLHDAIRGSPSKVVSMVMAKDKPRTPDADHILLATAIVAVESQGKRRIVRALIDPCSEVTLASESLVQSLRTSRSSCSHVVMGAGATPTATARGKAILKVSHRTLSSVSCVVEALILPRLTSYVPRGHPDRTTWPHLSGLTMADPFLTSERPVDLLLGADVLPSILLNGVRRGNHRQPVAQETIFGWILSGPTGTRGHSSTATHSHVCTTEDLPSLVKRFWEQEEVSPTTSLLMTREETACESLFSETHRRDSTGRYIVRLCFKQPPENLGDTHCIARRILKSNERRLEKDPQLRTAYVKFMSEYEHLGHMQAVPIDDWVTQKPHFYLPHHGVLKVTDTSPKLRVVFNGSRNSSTGTSLNAHLSAGPKLQRDLLDVLLRWRRHKIAFIADIEKMYRQINVHRDDWDFQRILWRKSSEDPIIPHHLTTVTYGLTCAPYLALRTLLQLATDEGSRYPLGAAILQDATYVDDILSGSDTVEDALKAQKELIDICMAGGFTLKKWNANHGDLLSRLSPDCLAGTSHLPWHPDVGCSALGLTWHPDNDDLSFTVKTADNALRPTKRSVLSQIARLFDPLGWLAPFIIRGKMFIQTLWTQQLDWDDKLPPAGEELWRILMSEMPTLTTIRIPRWIGVCQAHPSRQMHVFVDASAKAYAAVAYLRVDGHQGRGDVSLLAAKSKTAPLKVVSLPRLELCAAVLGARLLVRLRRELRIPIDDVHLWSDSTVSLAWLRGEPSRWNTFVANRVSEVQILIPEVHLHHVGTLDNPADCASRGITADQLRDHHLWWHGPEWLSSPRATWDASPPSLTTTEEARSTASSLHTCTPTVPPLLLQFSSLGKLLRVTAWCLRWRNPTRQSSAASPLILRSEEIHRAEQYWIKTVQLSCYPDGAQSRRLRSMAPHYDAHGVLRVGGRIRHSLLSNDEQHPIILAPDSPLTTLLIDDHHRRTLHGGVQLTLASLRQRFWIPQGRQQVKKCLSRCLTCLRWRAATKTQRMGDLPSSRVTPARPFLHAGVDYAGPVAIRTTAGRGHKATKGYIAIFVCFSSRAVHIEAVSDYTSSAFLAAFRRFTGRRGLCSTLTSDCGTNFIGADQELRRLFTASSKEMASIAYQLSKDGVQWRFIPPAAPHFGGLWEAAVRSVKHHLRRVIGDATLTFEELSTVLCQVEACLNSRPLQALTDDPEDLTPLTPGHFLVGEPLLSVPEPTLQDAPTTRLTRWQQQQQRVEHFWHRWSSEYLHQLQTRRKWTTTQPSLTIGDLVLVRSELTPPCKWPLARVVETHPGADGLVRVVSVKTATTILKRPVTKIVLLRSDPESEIPRMPARSR